MASKNIVLKGATWNGVESVDFPVSGGGTALYVETSDADATTSDIASGKKAYVNGSLIVGSATAPVLTTKSITQNGTYNASSDSADGYSSVTVNVSGGGGLVYESGTFTPAENVARPVISFSNSHTNLPTFVLIADTTNTEASNNSVLFFLITNWYDGVGAQITDSTNTYYARIHYGYKTTSSLSQGGMALSDYSGTTTTSSLGYYLSNTSFTPYFASSSRYFRTDRTYKWIAVWAPTS